jgi:type II secretory ATPase GspE/PulE/Tfp pilus assembly ATPase PilB-like protein
MTEETAVTLIDRVLERAARERASDVHIEPRAETVRLRFRIDGLLVEQPEIPLSLGSPVVSRLKVLARLDIAEKRLPQDGAFRRFLDGQDVDLRLSTFPTEHGEKVVLRLLVQDATRASFEHMGLSPQLATRLRQLSNLPYGMVLVTGPTGSGKTTTLYAMLSQIDARVRNVQTLEDPIEYRFEDIIQGQAHPKIGFTFARGLRAILRQDPDVILVGEMRDAETAEIAFKASLTGHLVLSTLHTATAIETFTRLFDIGLERYVVASALRAMLGQRLVRRLCPQCKRRVPLDHPTRELMGPAHHDLKYTFVPVGCPACNGTGYKGRVGVYELVEVDDDLADLVKAQTTTRGALREYMHQRGLYGLRASGLELVRKGLTAVAEVVRVT